MANAITAACVCGKVEMEASGAPIATVACYCDDCQAGGHMIEALSNAPKMLNDDGGTDFVVYRKDRARTVKGGEMLKSLKVKAGSPTNRVIATCCNSAMMLNFDDSKHWIDFYRARIRGSVPPAQMLVCTKFAPAPDRLPKDVRAYPGYAPSFLFKLMGAKLAMVLGF